MIEDDSRIEDYEAQEDYEYDEWRNSLTDAEWETRKRWLDSDYKPRAWIATLTDVDDSVYVEVADGVCVGLTHPRDAYDLTDEFEVKRFKLDLLDQYCEGIGFLPTDTATVKTFDNLLEI